MGNSKNTHKLTAWLVCVGTVASFVLGQPGLIVRGQATGTYSEGEFEFPTNRVTLNSHASTLLADTTALTLSQRTYLPLVTTPETSVIPSVGWAMAGANPQRTSWTSEEVRGQLKPEWYRVIDGYIPPHVQVIATNGLLFVSTAKGLYALSTTDGSLKWLFSTEMPLGNSPTIANGVAYVGGFDHKLYAIDIATGAKKWAFDEAGAGFDTNPLVVNGMVYLGNRDGYFYAIYSDDDAERKGTLAWRYPTAGPIHFSAAINKANSVLYFASDDDYAYALDAQTGALIWKSAKLPSAGFHSWWPTVTDQDCLVLRCAPLSV